MDARQQHILIEKIKLLYLHSLTPAILSGVAALFLIAALWSTANHEYLIIWFSITVILAIIRISLILRFKYVNPSNDVVLAWEKPYSISMLVVFLVWGVGLPIIVPKTDLASIFIVNTFAIGLAGAANSWYNSIRHIQIGAICIALLPMIGVLLSIGHPEAFWVGIAACCMFVSCIFTSLILQKTLNGNLGLAYDLALATKQAELVASTDALTGLNNRRAFFTEATKMLTYCKEPGLPVTLIMFDIDHFKKVNDAFGHAAGDAALQHIADLLRTKVRISDISCRFGGEEFAILLPNTDLQEAKITAEKLRTVIESNPVMFAERLIPLTASFGVANNGDSLDELINHADHAMYDAKEKGRNSICLYKTARAASSKKSAQSNQNTKVRTPTAR